MPVLVLGVVLVCALAMIPLGLPGTWAIVCAAIVYALILPHHGVGVVTIIGVATLALLAELFEFVFAARFTKRFGGSRRAGWGAVIGGFAGAAAGFPVPVVGPVIGGLAGSFLGALVAEYEASGRHRQAARVAYGALLARVASATTKFAIGVAMAAWLILAATT